MENVPAAAAEWICGTMDYAVSWDDLEAFCIFSLTSLGNNSLKMVVKLFKHKWSVQCIWP